VSTSHSESASYVSHPGPRLDSQGCANLECANSECETTNLAFPDDVHFTFMMPLFHAVVIMIPSLLPTTDCAALRVRLETCRHTDTHERFSTSLYYRRHEWPAHPYRRRKATNTYVELETFETSGKASFPAMIRTLSTIESLCA
jgi:hypothetical protein